MSRIARARPILLIAAVTVLPLALLTYFSLGFATQAVERQVEARLSSTASLSSTVVAQELQSLVELSESYAERPSLVEAVGDRRTARSREDIRSQLTALQGARRGVSVAFLVSTEGRVIDIAPLTPSIVGADFSFRDWYRGLTRTGRSYISEAIVGAATGNPRVIVSATYVRSREGQPLAILGVGYSLEYLQSFSDRLARAQRVKLNVTDQRGTLVASSGGLPKDLVSRRNDPRVRAALRGRSGLIELETPDGRRLSAYTPVSEVGWTVTTSVPANAAYAAVSDLRAAVLAVVALLALGMVGGLVLLARVLRQRARAEQEAREIAAINRAVLDSTPDAITMMDLEGNVVLRNATLERLTQELGGTRGDSATEALEHAAERTTDPAGFRGALQGLAEDTEKSVLYEFALADARRSFVLFSAPVTGRGGEPMGRIVTLHEVTSEREGERLKSELVATVSHELRTPLTGILGFAELVRNADLDVEKRNRYLDTIHHEAQRLTMLVNDFLDLQRMEAGAFTLAVEQLDLAEVLARQAELAQGPAADHEIRLELPDEPLLVAGDRERLGQVVGNFVSNAIKYSPGGGGVTIAAAHEDGAIRISVTDEGVGIPVDQQQKIFTKFFRVDSSDTRSIGGTGLGLALCREIVESHGGRIGFDSVPGAGSTFWFTLPAPRRAHGLASRRVLVVEDDPAAAEFLAACLAEDGLETEIVRTGEAALERAIADPPAAICLDMRLAGRIDGWNVLERVKATPATARIPVVVCTGNNGRSRAAALGAADFLAKPFRADVLRDAVNRVLPGMNGNVLVVDDDETVRRLVVETLAGNGYELAEAADGAEALAAIAEATPDAIVLDLFMPNMDGFEVLERLQDDPETRAIPVIVLTAHRLNAEQRSLLARRTVALLEKGMYSADELRALVARAAGLTTVG